METSLHQSLKALYADSRQQQEVRIGRYRIDTIVQDTLVEIQHSSLAAIRDKIADLLRSHRVLVVKPVVIRRHLMRCSAKGGAIVSKRLSPKRGTFHEIFDDLVHFLQVFPHPRLSLEVLEVNIEEWRYPGHGRRRRWRKNDYCVEDQKLLDVLRGHRINQPADLLDAIGSPLPEEFDTLSLATELAIPRWQARRVAYCLCKLGLTQLVGMRGNARVYAVENAREYKQNMAIQFDEYLPKWNRTAIPDGR